MSTTDGVITAAQKAAALLNTEEDIVIHQLAGHRIVYPHDHQTPYCWDCLFEKIEEDRRQE